VPTRRTATLLSAGGRARGPAATVGAVAADGRRRSAEPHETGCTQARCGGRKRTCNVDGGAARARRGRAGHGGGGAEGAAGRLTVAHSARVRGAGGLGGAVRGACGRRGRGGGPRWGQHLVAGCVSFLVAVLLSVFSPTLTVMACTPAARRFWSLATIAWGGAPTVRRCPVALLVAEASPTP